MTKSLHIPFFFYGEIYLTPSSEKCVRMLNMGFQLDDILCSLLNISCIAFYCLKDLQRFSVEELIKFCFYEFTKNTSRHKKNFFFTSLIKSETNPLNQTFS